MGETWQEGCPVPIEDLRYVTVSHWGFDGELHTGELVLHRDVAEDVVGVFARLHEIRFPIEEMRLITDADLDAPPTGDGNGTGSFICRVVRGGTSLLASTPSARPSTSTRSRTRSSGATWSSPSWRRRTWTAATSAPA